MSVKVRAKNPSNILQTLSCDANGQLNVAFDGLDLSTTNAKLDLNFGKLSNIQTITDTKLSAIQTFLDKDSGNQFHNDITNTKLEELKTLNTKGIQHISLLNHTISANSVGNVIDLSTYKTLGGTLWGNSDTHYNLVLQYSEDNITYFNIKNISVVNIENDLTFYEFLEVPPKYVRFLNPKNSNVSVNIHLDLIT